MNGDKPPAVSINFIGTFTDTTRQELISHIGINCSSDADMEMIFGKVQKALQGVKDEYEKPGAVGYEPQSLSELAHAINDQITNAPDAETMTFIEREAIILEGLKKVRTLAPDQANG